MLWLRQTARNVALAHILPPQERRQLLPAYPAVLVHHHREVTEAMTAERFVRRALSGCTQIAQPVPRANSKVKLCVRSAHVRTARPIRRATRVLPFAYATQVSAARMKGRVPAVPLVSTRACRDQQHVLHVKGARILQKVGQRSVGIAGGEHSWSSAAPPPPATVQRARAASIRMRLGLQAASRAVRVGTPHSWAPHRTRIARASQAGQRMVGTACSAPAVHKASTRTRQGRATALPVCEGQHHPWAQTAWKLVSA